MNSRISIDIAAPPDVVFRLARDAERWDRLLPHYARSRAIGDADGDGPVIEFIARRPLIRWLELGLPVVWRARVWADASGRTLRFHHVAGATKGMRVTWRIESAGPGARVEIEHDFSPPIPGFASFVDRMFTRPIAGRTLATFKALAEALWEPPEGGPSGG